MKKSIAMVCLGLAGSVFALDEYLPVAKGALEVDLGYSYTGVTGMYDVDGEKQDVPSGMSFSVNAVPIQLKYGIIPGLDVELLWAFVKTSEDFGDASGFSQPEIAVKYALMDIGAGLFINYALPFATGDFADPDQPPMALKLGAVYTKLFAPVFNLTAMAGYELNFEDANDFKAGNEISVFAKPEFRFNEFGGAYLGLMYSMAGESEAAGTGIPDSEANSFSLVPGWNATWTPMVSTEVNVPVSLMGKNSLAAWAIQAFVYLTLPL